MGCGQSKIHLYPRKSKSKANGKKGGHADSDAETDEDEGHIDETEKCQNREREKSNDDGDDQSNKDAQETDEEVSVSLLRAKNLSLLQSQEISTSQQNFFRMLDKKIEEGPDYDSNSETEIALEEARLNALVQHWESASLTASICSSASRSLQTTPIRQAPPIKQLTTSRGMLQAATAVPVPVPIPMQMPMPMSMTVPVSAPMQQQLQLTAADYLAHGATPVAVAQSAGIGTLKHAPNQQIVISHMNPKMMHPLAVVPPVPMGGMTPDTSATTANTSNALAMLQAASNQTQQQYAHLLTLPAGASPQLVGTGKPNVSPKRLLDGRLLINSSPIAQQMHVATTTLGGGVQYIGGTTTGPPTIAGAAAPQATPAYANGGRLTQPQIPMQMSYYGQATAQQQQQQASAGAATIMSQNDLQQQQLQQQQTPQSQNQQYYGDQMQNIQAPTEYKFPPAISVQRLAPQVQRQLRETQELIKDSCPQLFAAGYGGSPGPPIRSQAHNPTRRPTLETQFSQESS